MLEKSEKLMKTLIPSLILMVASFTSEANVIKYPERAERLRIDGEISVLYDINKSGKVENVRVTKTDPPYIFERSVRKQISLWEFPSGEPRTDQLLKIIFKAN